jgi:hypothetical protein
MKTCNACDFLYCVKGEWCCKKKRWKKICDDTLHRIGEIIIPGWCPKEAQ